MNNCKLCQTNPADKTGSHIIPHFLLKRIDNVDGSKDRGKELGFFIKTNDTQTYFGQAVLPEKLEEVYGEITDEDIDTMKNNPSIVDHFFCTSCEKKFSQVESEYAQTLKKFDTNIYKSGIDCRGALLFWMSILWRASIAKSFGYSLDETQEELTRKVLFKYLKEKYCDIDFKELTDDENCQNLAYRLVRSQNHRAVYPTAAFCHPTDTKPYSFMIDEYILYFYFSRGDIDEVVQDSLGLMEFIKSAPPNTVKEGEYILPIAAINFTASIEHILSLLLNSRFESYNDMFDEIHHRLVGGGEMDVTIKQEILNEITRDKQALGRKYTREDAIRCAFKVLKQYIKQK